MHLAAEPRHTPDIGWDLLMPDNVIATANVFETAKQAGVSRIIFFSSMHVVGMYERDQPYTAIAEGDYGDLDPATVPLITHDMPDRPDGPYAVSKYSAKPSAATSTKNTASASSASASAPSPPKTAPAQTPAAT